MTFRPLPSDEVLFHEEAGEAFLLNVKSGEYFGLNRSGVIVWRALVDGLDPDEVLARRWPDMPGETLRRDTRHVLEELLQAGLVVESDDPPGGV